MSGTVRYRVDPAASRLTVKAFAGGALSAMGHNPSFTVRELRGEVAFDPDAPDASSLQLVALASSLALADSVSEKDRREIEQATNATVLESGRYAEIRYDCPAERVAGAGPMQFTLNGELTLHGVTREQRIMARVFLMGNTLRGQGDATVRQSEFGIRPYTAAGGMLKVKDEVKLSFDIVARADPAVDAG